MVPTIVLTTLVGVFCIYKYVTLVIENQNLKENLDALQEKSSRKKTQKTYED